MPIGSLRGPTGRMSIGRDGGIVLQRGRGRDGPSQRPQLFRMHIGVGPIGRSGRGDAGRVTVGTDGTIVPRGRLRGHAGHRRVYVDDTGVVEGNERGRQGRRIVGEDDAAFGGGGGESVRTAERSDVQLRPRVVRQDEGTGGGRRADVETDGAGESGTGVGGGGDGGGGGRRPRRRRRHNPSRYGHLQRVHRRVVPTIRGGNERGRGREGQPRQGRISPPRDARSSSYRRRRRTRRRSRRRASGRLLLRQHHSSPLQAKLPPRRPARLRTPRRDGTIVRIRGRRVPSPYLSL
mmetsp:Transcript_42881/g.130467  ORF Transcript_42881/g.130467 Transcript_42881/m.130467 type:complete len:292 (-) Transcript_42881:2472-3347(-)